MEEARQHSAVDKRGFQLALIYLLRAGPLGAMLVIVGGFTGLVLPQHAVIVLPLSGAMAFSMALFATWQKQEFWAMSRAGNPGCFWSIIAWFAAIMLVCLAVTWFLIANW